MTDIDWSKAPEGATHWEPESDLVKAGWMKKDSNGDWLFWSYRNVWTKHMITPSRYRLVRMVARPAEIDRSAAIEAVMADLNLAPECRYIAERVLSAGYRKQEAV